MQGVSYDSMPYEALTRLVRQRLVELIASEGLIQPADLQLLVDMIDKNEENIHASRL